MQLTTEAAAHWGHMRQLSTPHLYHSVLECLQTLLSVPAARAALNDERLVPLPAAPAQLDRPGTASTATKPRQVVQTTAQALLEALAYQRCGCEPSLMCGEEDTAELLDDVIKQVSRCGGMAACWRGRHTSFLVVLPSALSATRTHNKIIGTACPFWAFVHCSTCGPCQVLSVDYQAAKQTCPKFLALQLLFACPLHSTMKLLSLCSRGALHLCSTELRSSEEGGPDQDSHPLR